MLIRAEEPQDQAVVYALNAEAFEQPGEARLVDALREQVTPLISLVAEENRELVGHILFSPVSLSGNPDLKIIGLAPMAVVPEHQRSGIGSALVGEGLERCKHLGFTAVVVLGHPNYYPRFGFVPSSGYRIDSEYDVPEAYFMALELQPGALADRPGRVKYHSLFNSL
jgi:putative acetyltransferase